MIISIGKSKKICKGHGYYHWRVSKNNGSQSKYRENRPAETVDRRANWIRVHRVSSRTRGKKRKSVIAEEQIRTVGLSDIRAILEKQIKITFYRTPECITYLESKLKTSL